MNKAKRKSEQMQRHLNNLHTLAIDCNANKTDGATLYRTLRRLEMQAERNAIRYCNGAIEEIEFTAIETTIKKAINSLFNGNLKVFLLIVIQEVTLLK